MASETKYGVISDVHRDPRIVKIAIGILKKLGATKLVLNGDIGERQETLQASQDYVAIIMDSAGKSGLETYVQPGSHESVLTFQPVAEYFRQKYSNLISVFDAPKIENEDYHLVFLPGSDFTCGGEYAIGDNENIPSCLYLSMKSGLVPYSKETLMSLAQQEEFQGLIHYSNMHDLKKLVNDGEKTIVFCHVPRKFDSIENAVDVASFAETQDKSVIPYSVLEAKIKAKYGNISKGEIRLIAAANGLTLKEENRGNEGLKKIYSELGIRKAVNGHFHESGHRAHDGNVNAIPQGTFVDELYWNSGHLDIGQAGILTVRDGKVSYQNIQLKDYLR